MGASLGRMLRHLRKASGQTLEQVADAVGITPAALSLFETGKRNPSPKVLGLIAGVFNYPVDDLLTMLDYERTTDRLEDARSSAKQSGWEASPRMAASPSSWDRMPRSGRVYSAQPIDALFAAPEVVGDVPVYKYDDGVAAANARPDSWSPPHFAGSDVPVRHLRAQARHDSDISSRLEAIDALADNASLALRTLKGLAEDGNPEVRREAQRMLRELGVDTPSPTGEDTQRGAEDLGR